MLRMLALVLTIMAPSVHGVHMHERLVDVADVAEIAAQGADPARRAEVAVRQNTETLPDPRDQDDFVIPTT